MILQKLIDNLEKITHDLGYPLHVGNQREVNTKLRHLPAAWLEYPSIEEITGRESGTITYSVSMYLICNSGQLNQINNLNKLEQIAINISNQLPKESEIREITKFETSPQCNYFPPLADTTLKLTFEITMDYNSKALNND